MVEKVYDFGTDYEVLEEYANSLIDFGEELVEFYQKVEEFEDLVDNVDNQASTDWLKENALRSKMLEAYSQYLNAINTKEEMDSAFTLFQQQLKVSGGIGEFKDLPEGTAKFLDELRDEPSINEEIDYESDLFDEEVDESFAIRLENVGSVEDPDDYSEAAANVYKSVAEELNRKLFSISENTKPPMVNNSIELDIGLNDELTKEVESSGLVKLIELSDVLEQMFEAKSPKSLLYKEDVVDNAVGYTIEDLIEMEKGDLDSSDMEEGDI